MNQINNPQFFSSVVSAFQSGDDQADKKETEISNVDCLQLMYHAITRQEFETVVDLCTDDIDFQILGPPNIPFVGRWHGKEEVLVALKNNFAQVKDQHPQIESLTAQGNMIVVIAREQGRLAACDSPYTVNWVQEFTFVDGRLARMREIIDSGADFPTV